MLTRSKVGICCVRGRAAPDSAAAHNDLAWLLATDPTTNCAPPAGGGTGQEATRRAPEGELLEHAGCGPLPGGELAGGPLRPGEVDSAGQGLQRRRLVLPGYDRLAAREQGRRREWFEKAARWMEQNAPRNEELRRFRAEAATLLHIKENKVDTSSNSILASQPGVSQRATRSSFFQLPVTFWAAPED